MTTNKYGNRKVAIDGYVFDSLLEGRRYEQLRLLQQAGEIEALVVHPPRYILIDGFTTAEGVKIRPTHYTPDFYYRTAEGEVVEDCKGVRTKEFNIKAKLFQQRYPEISFRVLTNEDV